MTTATGPEADDRPIDNTAEIETPEHVRFRYRVAGPARRALAYLIDLVIRAFVLFVLGALVAMAFGVDMDSARQASTGVILVLLFVVEWGYYVVFETATIGGSPGKRALRLRVVKEGGFPVGFKDSLLRNLLRAVDFLPQLYVLGALVMAGDRRFRRLGDLVAGTMVVVDEPPRVVQPLWLDPPAAPGELESLPHRPPLTAAEREAIEAFLRRRDLAPARRQEMAEQLAPLLARRMGLPPSPDPARFLALVHARATPARAEARAR